MRVGVLVDLPLDRHAGGHAKFWRRIGEAALARDPLARRRMGVMARRYAEQTLPSWRDLLVEDLLPVWRGAAAAKAVEPGRAAAPSGGFALNALPFLAKSGRDGL